nr:hypothetical protein [Acidiferrobacterales bacterium]
NTAERVFCISNFQHELLGNNGIQATLLPEGVGVFEEASQDPSKVENTSEVSKIALLTYSLDAQVQVLQALIKAADSEGLSALEIRSVDFSQLSNYQEKKAVEGIQINVRGCWQDFEDISRFIQEMDIVILCSAWRSQSDLLIEEATAAGAWLVMPESILLADGISCSEVGYLYSPDDKDKLIAIFKELISNGQREGKKDVFSLTDNVDQLINHYRDIHSSIHSDTL